MKRLIKKKKMIKKSTFFRVLSKSNFRKGKHKTVVYITVSWIQNEIMKKNSPRAVKKNRGACDDKPTTRNSSGSAKMGIRTVSITRALIKYLLVRGISTRGHGRHQSSRLDAGVHPSAVDNPEAAELHRFPTLPHVAAMKNASRGRVHTTRTIRGWPTDRVGNMQPDACTQTAD